MSDTMEYKHAIEEIEGIVEEIENEAVDVDMLTEKIRRAAYLIKYCKQKLRKTDKEINKVLNELEGVKEAGDDS